VGLRAHAASVARTCTKAGAQHDGAGRMSGDDFSSPPLRKTPSDMLALKPYWGKLTVRNFRGDYGNVGIIRSPVRAIALLDNSNRQSLGKCLRADY
jgi:hypothetical protein